MDQAPQIPSDIQTWLGHEWRGREWGAPILASGAVWVTGGMLHTLELPFVVGLCVGMATTIAVMVSVRSGRRFSQELQLHLFISSFWATGFLTWTSFDSAWVSEQLRMLTLTAGLMWPIIATLTWKHVRLGQIAKEYGRAAAWWRDNQPKPVTAGPAAQTAPVEANPVKAYWRNMFAAWGVNGIEFVGQKSTSTGNRLVRLRLPSNGSVSFKQVMDKGENVAITMSSSQQPIPPTAVTIRRYVVNGIESATDFIVEIDLVDVLSHIQWMPEDHTPRSITEAFQIGVYQDGTPMFMTVQEIHWIIAAASRAGKSNLLGVILYHLSLCYDAVVWAIDMKGGSTFKHWLKAFFDRAINPHTGQRVRRPIIDWLGVDKHEAERILRAFIAIVSDRPHRRQGTKTRVSAEHPHIILLVDELSRLTGTHANTGTGKGAHSTVFGALFTEACSIGAGEGGTIIGATQRGTVDYGLPGNAMANILGRICLGMTNLQDIRQVITNPLLGDIAKTLRYKGSLVCVAGPKVNGMAGRAFFLGDDDEFDRRSYEAGLLHGDIVPGLTEGTWEHEVACIYGYIDRWQDPQRIGWHLGTHRGEWIGKPIKAAASVGTTGPAASTATAAPAGGPVGGFFNPPPVSTPQKPTSPPPAAPRSGGGAAGGGAPSPADPFDEIIRRDFSDAEIEQLSKAMDDAVGHPSGHSGEAEPPEASSATDADRVQLLIRIVDEAGPEGIMPREISAKLIDLGVITSKGTTAVHRWMKDARDPKHGDMTVEQPGGARTHYYTRRHIRTSRRAE